MAALKRAWPWLTLLVLLSCAIWSWQSGGIVAELTASETTSAEKVDALRQYFDDCGVWAPVVYILFVTVEVVVAPIPGVMLYAPGGLIFGPLLGGTLALAGNTLGAGLACQLGRSASERWRTRFTQPGPLQRIQKELQLRGGWWIFLLRVNPLTSTDLVSWAAGLTRIPTTTVMLATACGMAPLCYLQSWMSDAVFTRFPVLIVPLLVLSAGYVVAVVMVLRRVLRQTA